jgi:Zn-dependent protease with chaperone function
VTERSRALILTTPFVATLTCLGWLLVCPHRPECLRALTRLDSWISASGRVVLPLLALSLVVWLLRLLWLVAAAALATRRLPRAPLLPPELSLAMARTGLDRICCMACETPTAFCAGALRPRVVVSQGLVRRLGTEELEVVLLHEQEHARRLEPLLRAAYQAAAEVFFYVPLVRWWARRQIEDSELRADRVALERLGSRPVAAALLALGGGATVSGAAAFSGLAELRVAQVLGDPLPRRAPEFSIAALSAMGVYLTLQVGSCLSLAGQPLV